jgi:hypothetical protein
LAGGIAEDVKISVTGLAKAKNEKFSLEEQFSGPATIPKVKLCDPNLTTAVVAVDVLSLQLRNAAAPVAISSCHGANARIIVVGDDGTLKKNPFSVTVPI